jgi:pectin methylesterase-like acyl-CoA thioesterase
MFKPLILGAAMAVAVPAVAVVVSALPAHAATPAHNGVYTLAIAASGKCLEVAGGSADNGALLQQATCTAGLTRQQWRVVSSSAGGFNLVNLSSTRCTDVPSGSTASGVQLQQWGCGDGTKVNQRWSFAASSAASGRYTIASAASGLCVSDKDGSTASNNPIVQETCADVARMQWLFGQVGSDTTPTVAADGTGTYRTVQAAIDAVPAGNTTRRVITIKAGTYREVIRVPSNKPLITLQGLGSGPSNVVIVFNNSAGTHGTSGSATAFVDGRDFAATNLTISNDFDENSASSGHQAVALNLNADRAVFNNVRLLGDQDTFLVNDATRAYVVNSYVEGTVDFIFGGGTIVFNNCAVYEKRTTGGPITAASTAATKTYGFLFYRSNITGAANNVTQLGRPWRPDAQVLYRESTLSATIRTAQPWTDMSGNLWQNARFLEYRNTGSGAGTNGNRPQLSDSQAANYTPQRYLAGSDGWNPL